jgi:hypothetical protein
MRKSQSKAWNFLQDRNNKKGDMMQMQKIFFGILAVALAMPAIAESGDGKCHTLKNAEALGAVFCTAGSDCVNESEMKSQLSDLNKVFNDDVKNVLNDAESVKKNKQLRDAGIGIAVGTAGAAGIATAITAFVEKGNINCRVGDGLYSVGMGKSQSIDSLKDFYVKWNLKLPDVVSVSATDCATWTSACAAIIDLNQCPNATVNYKPAETTVTTMIPGGCAISGSTCIEDRTVARTFGACL